MPCLWIRRCFPVHAVTNSWLFNVLWYFHSPIVLRAFQPCSSVWNSTLSLNSLQFFCLKWCLWSVLLWITPSVSLGFSLCRSLFCVSQGGWTALFCPSSHVTQSHYALPCVRPHLYEPEVHKHAPYHSFLIALLERFGVSSISMLTHFHSLFFVWCFHASQLTSNHSHVPHACCQILPYTSK